MKTRTKHFALCLLLLVLLSLACRATAGNPNTPDQQNDIQNQDQSAPENQPNQEAPPEEEDTKTPTEEVTIEPTQEIGDFDFFQQIDNGVITIEGVLANSEDEDTFGQIMTLQLTNPGTEEVIVTVPCGLVFTPSDEENQRMMMVQPLEVSLAAGETKSPTPYVVCIDVDAGAPKFNNTYSIGSLVDNPDLLKFAQCICNQELSTELGSMDGVGVQMAAWSVSVGGDFSNILEENSAMADMLEQEFGDSLGEAMDQFRQMVSMFGDEWLDECEIELEKEQ